MMHHCKKQLQKQLINILFLEIAHSHFLLPSSFLFPFLSADKQIMCYYDKIKFLLL